MAKRIFSLDFLRASSILAVLVWHLKLLNLIPTRLLSETARNVVYYNITLLAVPVFFIVSFFLLAQRLNKTPNYIRLRLGRLTKIYVFWFLVGSIFTLAVILLKFGSSFLYNLPNVFQLLLTGGHLSYFYITSLLILSAILGFLSPKLKRLNRNTLILCALVSSIIFSYISADGYIYEVGLATNTANFLNYLPFVFIAYCLHKDRSKINKFFIFFLAAIIVASLIVEYWVLKFDTASAIFPYYGRLSVYFSAWLVVYLSLRIPFKNNRLVNILSLNTLGIYAVHVLTLDVATGILVRKGIAGPEFIALRTVLTILSTLLVLSLMKHSQPLRQFIE